MTNEPPKKFWPHLARKSKRFPENSSAVARPEEGHPRLRKALSGAALLVALFAFAPLVSRVQDRMSNAKDGVARVTDCDRVAAHPSDTQKLAPGLAQDKVDIAAGKAACAEALQRQPGDGRTLYQLGRMYFYGREFEPALDYMRQSAAAGYAQGQFVLGLILVQGNGTAPDACEGGRLWVKAARQRHLYSKLYLASNWRDGMFKDCRLDVSDAEIEAMLTAADDLVVTQEQRDDLAQAKANWARL